MSTLLKKLGKSVVGFLLIPFILLGMVIATVLAYVVDLLIGVIAAPFALLFLGVMTLGERQEERILKYGTPEQKQQVYDARWRAEQRANRPYGKSGGSY